MTSEPSMIRLRNGTELAEPALRATMINLSDFFQREPIAFYELVCMCQDGMHHPFGNTGDKLRAAGFLDGWCVPTSIRNVVLSAIRGDGDTVDGSMYLGSPVAGQP